MRWRYGLENEAEEGKDNHLHRFFGYPQQRICSGLSVTATTEAGSQITAWWPGGKLFPYPSVVFSILVPRAFSHQFSIHYQQM